MLVREEYTVIDLGNPFGRPVESVCYNAETRIIFGGNDGGQCTCERSAKKT